MHEPDGIHMVKTCVIGIPEDLKCSPPNPSLPEPLTEEASTCCLRSFPACQTALDMTGLCLSLSLWPWESTLPLWFGLNYMKLLFYVKKWPESKWRGWSALKRAIPSISDTLASLNSAYLLLTVPFKDEFATARQLPVSAPGPGCTDP